MGKPKVSLSALQKGNIDRLPTISGEMVTCQFAIVELTDLICSNHLNGEVNCQYPQELQPRNRTTPKSVAKTAAGSRDLSLSWLGHSKNTATGAPIAGSDMVIESGNGRVMSIRKAYADSVASRYRHTLAVDAHLFGLTEQVVSSMAMPVLVRIRRSKVDRVKFAQDCNHDAPDPDPQDSDVRKVTALMESVEGGAVEAVRQCATAGEMKRVMAVSVNPFPSMDSENHEIEEAFYKLGKSLMEGPLARREFDQVAAAMEAVDEAALQYGDIRMAMGSGKRARARLSWDLLNLSGHDVWNGVIDVLADLSLPVVAAQVVDAAKRLFEGSMADALQAQQDLNNDHTMKKLIGFERDFPGFLLLVTGVQYTPEQLAALVHGQMDWSLAGFDPVASLSPVAAEQAEAIIGKKGPGTTPEQREQYLADQVELWRPRYENSRSASLQQDAKRFDTKEGATEMVAANLVQQATWGARNDVETQIEKLSALASLTTQQSRQLKSLRGKLSRLNSKSNLGTSETKAMAAAINEFIRSGKLPKPGRVGTSVYQEMARLVFNAEHGGAVAALEEHCRNYQLKTPSTSAPSIELHESFRQYRDKIQFSASDLDSALASLHRLVGEQVPEGLTFFYDADNPRAYHSKKAINVGARCRLRIIFHEVGHAIEDEHPALRAACDAFLRQRHQAVRAKTKVVSLRKTELAGGGYRQGEVAVANFVRMPYAYKVYPAPSAQPSQVQLDHLEYYPDPLPPMRASELLSMGFECMTSKGAMASLMADKGHFTLVLAALDYLNSQKGRAQS